MTGMKRVVLGVLLALAAAAGGLAYQVAARDRDYRALLVRGDAALRGEQAFAAIEAYSGAIALRQDSMLAYLRRGETYHRRGDRGDLEQAARDFRTAAALDPAATRPLEELGDVLFELHRYSHAVDAYSRCWKVDDRSARISYKLALVHYTAGDLDAAIAMLDQTLKLDSRMANAHYLLGMSLRDKHRPADARGAFEQAVALSPGLVAAREELADLYRSMDRHADELEQLQVIAGLDRAHLDRQVSVGLAQARAGHGDLAVATLGSALEHSVEADQPLIYGALGQVWLDLAEARSDSVALGKALEALGRAASDPAATSDVLTLYGRALLRDGRTELAEEALDQAATRYPLEPTALLWYAAAAERQGHVETARRALVDYNGLVADDGDGVGRAMRIAALSLRLNDPRTAVTWLRRASGGRPPDARLLTALADAEVRSGDRDAARRTVARGLEKDPNNPVLRALERRVQ